jgi:hypothetical protein
MIKKQIIGSVLMLFFILELIAFEVHRSSYQHREYCVYGITEEMFYFFIGVFIFLTVWVAGILIWRKKLLIYSSISWAVTSGILGTLALWAFVLMKDPTESEWGALAQSGTYYIIGSLQSQTAISLAVLALCASREVKSRFLSVFVWLCLVFGSTALLLYLGYIIPMIYEASAGHILLYAISINTVPIGAIVPLILFISKEKSKR